MLSRLTTEALMLALAIVDTANSRYSVRHSLAEGLNLNRKPGHNPSPGPGPSHSHRPNPDRNPNPNHALDFTEVGVSQCTSYARPQAVNGRLDSTLSFSVSCC